MIKRIYYLFFLLILTVAAYSVPATPLPVKVTLADGSTAELYLRGDEHAHYYTTLDSVPVRIEQGKLIEDFTLPQTTLQKRRKAQVSNAKISTFPNTGSPRSIVILVNFADKKFIHSREDFVALLNQSGYKENGCIGSARDYFIASSDSAFRPIFDVYGPYDLPQDMEYYGKMLSDDIHDANPDKMIIHACSAAEKAGVDFSLYDENQDGKIDNVFVYYAGHNQAEGAASNTIWPHRSAIGTQPQYGGKRLYDYACTSELRHSVGTTMCGPGTFCHEFSHVLGLADLYDIYYTKKTPTVGYWDLMASGSYNGDGCMPPTYTAFERFSVGWLQPELITEPGRYILEPLATANKAFLITANNTNVEANTNAEYFLLENRQRLGWDAGESCLCGTDMLVWHIDYNAALWANNCPNGGQYLSCFIECARGSRYTDGHPSDPFPGMSNKTIFTPTLVNGTDLGKPLLDIKRVGDDISFVFIGDGKSYLAFTPNEIEPLRSSYTQMSSGKVVSTMTATKVFLQGASLSPVADIEIKTSHKDFQVSLDSLSWNRYIIVHADVDSTINTPLYVRYRPVEQVCGYVEATLQAKQLTALQTLSLKATAPRDILITAPKPTEVSNITPYSAELNWLAVPDATDYYLTLYQVKNGETRYEESFETFDSPSAVAVAGWESNFNTLSSTQKESGNYSLWFKQSGNYILTEKYVQPITNLSFWYSVPTTDVDIVGGLLVEGFDGTTWSMIDSLVVKKRDRKQTYEADLKEKQYIQFRMTFASNEGGNGVCVDSYTAVCGTYIDYIYQGDDFVLKAVDGERAVKCYINGLEPQQEYFYKVRVSDKGRKGCEEHIKEMKDAQSFRTLIGYNEERDLTAGLDSIHYSQPEHVIYVPEATGDRTLYFYDLMGQLIGQVAVASEQNRVAFPMGNFIEGNIYIVKYSVTDKLKRKDRRIKIIY